MKQVTIECKKFHEWDEETQERIISEHRDINVDRDWWISTYEDASNVGIKITGFALDRNRHCTGKIDYPFDTAKKIVEEHGESCETYKTSKSYLEDYNKIMSYEATGTEEEEEIIDKDIEEEIRDLDEEFIKSILEDYSIMLQREYEYLQEDEAIISTFEANEYEFDKEGKIW